MFRYHLQLKTYSFQPKHLGDYQFNFSMDGAENTSCVFDLQSQNITEIVITKASGVITCGNVGRVCVKLLIFLAIFCFSQLISKIQRCQICQLLSG